MRIRSSRCQIFRIGTFNEVKCLCFSTKAYRGNFVNAWNMDLHLVLSYITKSNLTW